MNKKIIFIVIAFIIAIFVVYIVCFNNKKKVTCNEFTGGGFEIIFNTNGGNKIESMHTCIACSPDSYPLLPIPTKEGYIFDGWYYDKSFNNKVAGDSSLDVNPKESFDKNGCRTGYENVTLYAKWVE